MDMHMVFREFADGTSMHGVPRIINARSLPARVFWSIICLGAFGMFLWQCGILLERYYSYPKKVNVEIAQRPIPFPSVTVCNTDFLDLEVAQVLNTMLYEDAMPMNESEFSMDMDYSELPPDMDMGAMPTATESPNSTQNKYKLFRDSYTTFWDASSQVFSAFYPLAFQVNKMNEDMMEVYSRLGLAANLGAGLSSMAGIQLNDFIAGCRFLDDDCNITRSFLNHFDPYYFNCYTFNPEAIITNRATRLKGVEYGLSLLLFTGSAGSIVAPGNVHDLDYVIPGMQESDSALASGRGTRVVVHPPDTMPHPTADGYDVPPGFSVTIGVKARENVRIQYPHGNCSDDGGPDYANSTFRYTLMKCQNDCIQRTIMDNCGCVDNRISTPEDTNNLPFCFQIPELPPEKCSINPLVMADMGGPGMDMSLMYDPICIDLVMKWGDMLECRKDVYENMTVRDPDAMDDICKCYPPCNDLTYDTSYSLSILPEKSDEHTAFYAIIDKFLQQGMSQSKRDIFMSRQGDSPDNWTAHYSTASYISRLNVHISDSNIIKTTESPDYEAIRLISDIGGQLGLWIGISVMTLFEVLQLMADVCRFLTVKGRHVGEKKQHAKMVNNRYGNGQRFRPHNDLDVEMQCEVDKLTTV